MPSEKIARGRDRNARTADARKRLSRIGRAAELPFPAHPHMPRHACGLKLARRHGRTFPAKSGALGRDRREDHQAPDRPSVLRNPCRACRCRWNPGTVPRRTLTRSLDLRCRRHRPHRSRRVEQPRPRKPEYASCPPSCRVSTERACARTRSDRPTCRVVSGLSDVTLWTWFTFENLYGNRDSAP